jgi:hypothetical protein
MSEVVRSGHPGELVVPEQVTFPGEREDRRWIGDVVNSPGVEIDRHVPEAPTEQIQSERRVSTQHLLLGRIARMRRRRTGAAEQITGRKESDRTGQCRHHSEKYEIPVATPLVAGRFFDEDVDVSVRRRTHNVGRPSRLDTSIRASVGCRRRQVVNASLVLGNVYGGPEEIWNPVSNGAIWDPPGRRGNRRGARPYGNSGRERLPAALHGPPHESANRDGSDHCDAKSHYEHRIRGDLAKRRLACPPGRNRGAQSYGHPIAVTLIDLRTGIARILPGTQESVQPDYGPVNVTWSSNGWLFAAAIGSTHVLVWRPGDRSAMVLSKANLPGLDLGIPPGMRSQLPILIAS